MTRFTRDWAFWAFLLMGAGTLIFSIAAAVQTARIHRNVGWMRHRMELIEVQSQLLGHNQDLIRQQNQTSIRDREGLHEAVDRVRQRVEGTTP